VCIRAFLHKVIRPWLLRILEFSLVESVMGFHFRVHERNFGL
jgi:hypothetical protein